MIEAFFWGSISQSEPLTPAAVECPSSTPIFVSPSEQLTYATVRIEGTLADGRTTSGTGFFFRLKESDTNHVPVIVTNKHVVAGARQGKFLMHALDETGRPSPSANLWIEIDNFEQVFIKHPDPDVDLCCLPIGALVNGANRAGKRFFYVWFKRA